MRYLLLFLILTLSLLQSTAQRHDSSFTQKIKPWVKPSIAIGYAGVTYTAYKYLDHLAQDESQEGKSKSKKMIANIVNPFGVGKYNSIALGSVALFSIVSKNKKLQQTAVIWAGSAALNALLVQQLKRTFQRHRPNTGDPYNTFDWRNGPGINSSFPSAHTANVFCAATVFATMYKDQKWVPVVAYSMATLTGLSRIYNNAHWASDVMTGAAVGYLSAKLMIKAYGKMSQKFMILPGINRNYGLITATYKF